VKTLRSVTVYCGSNPGADPAFAEATRRLATQLARDGIRIVYGGGHVGLMGILADTALAAGGEVLGVIPQFLADREVAHAGLTELRVVATMHERKQLMTDLSDAFIVLSGGLGTLDELIEAFTWTQLGIHDKPIGVLNVGGYYDPLLAFLDAAVEQGFVDQTQRNSLIVAGDPATLLDEIDRWRPKTLLI
jgi:uncharacterized protein (TIGR00730 family)